MRDATAAYQLGADSFLAKSTDFKNGVRLMLLLMRRWLLPTVDTEAAPPPIPPERGSAPG